MRLENGPIAPSLNPRQVPSNFLLCLIPTLLARAGTLTSFLIGEDVSKMKTIVYWNILSFPSHPGKVLPGYSHPSLLVVPATVKAVCTGQLGMTQY